MVEKERMSFIHFQGALKSSKKREVEHGTGIMPLEGNLKLTGSLMACNACADLLKKLQRLPFEP